MNPTKAAAILVLVVAVFGAGDLIYQYAVVRPRYEANVLHVLSCQTGRQAAIANWEYVQSHIELLKAQGNYKEAFDFQKQHAGERPEFIGECDQFVDLTAPAYPLPAGVAVVGLIISLALFGMARQQTLAATRYR